MSVFLGDSSSWMSFIHLLNSRETLKNLLGDMIHCLRPKVSTLTLRKAWVYWPGSIFVPSIVDILILMFTNSEKLELFLL